MCGQIAYHDLVFQIMEFTYCFPTFLRYLDRRFRRAMHVILREERLEPAKNSIDLDPIG
jgi:hypothetical protein